MKPETFARMILFFLMAAAGFVGVLAVAPNLLARAAENTHTLRARMPENGGWSLETIQAQVGQPIHLRMTSDDVLHSFAIGQSDADPIDLLPGEWSETTLVFDLPGRYTYYCTRWCGRNHWRMRGTIEVEDPQNTAASNPTAEKPLYLQLKLDVDAPHPAEATPQAPPSAARGQALLDRLPAYALERHTYRISSPSALWLRLRVEDSLKDLSGAQLWDAVAAVWARQVTPAQLERAARLYAVNCAACHGETGRGDGVMVEGLPRFTPGQAHNTGEPSQPEPGHSDTGHPGSTASGQFAETDMGLSAPPDFSDPAGLLGASPALLEGKLLRGGMGTGMPYWGPIFTQPDLDALVAYMYGFAWREQ